MLKANVGHTRQLLSVADTSLSLKHMHEEEHKVAAVRKLFFSSVFNKLSFECV